MDQEKLGLNVNKMIKFSLRKVSSCVVNCLHRQTNFWGYAEPRWVDTGAACKFLEMKAAFQSLNWSSLDVSRDLTESAHKSSP